jgi:hypothetical protein
VTAKRRIAPTAMRMIEVPIPMTPRYPGCREINPDTGVFGSVHEGADEALPPALGCERAGHVAQPRVSAL